MRPAGPRLVGAGGLALTLLAMTITLGLALLVVFGAQYVSIGLWLEPVSRRDLQQALSHALALPAATYMGARLASSGPEHRTQAALAALLLELAITLSRGWWHGQHWLVVPSLLGGCLLGLVAARAGARASAPPHLTR